MNEEHIKALTEDELRVLAVDNWRWLSALLTELLPELFDQDTTLSQATVLMTGLIAEYIEGKPVTVSELASRLGKPRSTVQRTIDVAVERGEARYQTDRADTRHRVIRLTPQSVEKARRVELLVTNWRIGAYKQVLKATRPYDQKGLAFDARIAIEAYLEDVAHSVEDLLNKHTSLVEGRVLFGVVREDATE